MKLTVHHRLLSFLTSLIFLFLHQPIQGQGIANSGTIQADEFVLDYKIQGEGKPAIVIGSSKYYPRVFSKSYIRNGPYAWFDPHFDSTPLWEGIEVNMNMVNYMWGRVFRDIDITQGLDTFKIPVFLALGRYDKLVGPPSTWDPLRSKFHDLTVRVFEKSGHTPQFEQADLFDKELLDWLKLKK